MDLNIYNAAAGAAADSLLLGKLEPSDSGVRRLHRHATVHRHRHRWKFVIRTYIRRTREDQKKSILRRYLSRDRHEMKQEYKFIYFEGCSLDLEYFRDFLCAAAVPMPWVLPVVHYILVKYARCI